MAKKRKQPPPPPPLSRTILRDSTYLRMGTVEEVHLIAHLLAGFKPTPHDLIREFNLGLKDKLPPELNSCEKLAKLTCSKALIIYLKDRAIPMIGERRVAKEQQYIKVGCWEVTKGEAESFLKAIGYYGGSKIKSRKPFRVAIDHHARIDSAAVEFGYMDYGTFEVEQKVSIPDLYKAADIMSAKGWIKAR